MNNFSNTSMVSVLRIMINGCLISRYVSHYTRTNGRDFRACALAALGDPCANFTLFLANFGANDGMRNNDFLGIYHIRTHRNDRFYRLVFFSELLLLGIKM